MHLEFEIIEGYQCDGATFLCNVHMEIWWNYAFD